MLGIQESTNKKPQDKAATKSQGQDMNNGNGNSTTLAESKARWEKGQDLFKSGAVKIGKDGYFQVNGFRVHTDPVYCECPDFANRKKACKHVYASIAYVKARNGNGNGKVEHTSENASNKPKETHSKDFES